MSDLIDRQDAIDAITKYCTEYDLRDLLADLEVLPSAQKKGKWVDDTCSVCGYGVEPWNNTPYCPKCGAKMMRGDTDDNTYNT